MNKYTSAIVIVASLYLAYVSTVVLFRADDGLPEVSSARTQAVFLSDGQVYFGKLKNHNSGFAELSNVYYLKYGTSLQQGGSDQNISALNLVKLGGEVHGPEDTMYISKDKILFVENLKELSSVVQAIKKNGQ